MKARRNTGDAPLSQRPMVLHAASIERIEEAASLLEQKSWALSMYVAGLAVESLLQAFVHRGDSVHDAHHDLRRWLDKCPISVVDLIKLNAGREWSTLCAVWDNSLRYLSEDGLFGYLRKAELNRGLKGDRESILRTNASRCLAAARVIHNKGIVKWPKN